MTDHHRIVVQVSVVVQNNDYILLVQEGDPLAGKRWNLPGGHLEIGEAIQDCARRELIEETGLEIGALRLLGIYPALRSASVYAIRFVFLAKFDNTQLTAAGNEIIAVKWASPDEIANMTNSDLIAPEIFRRIMQDLANGVHYSPDVIAEPIYRNTE